MDTADLSRLYSDYCRGQRGGTHYDVLIGLLRQTWCKETASPSCQERWSPDNPAFGQCAVTSLIVQDVLGGELIRTVVEGYGSHYLNRLPAGEDGMLYDLTFTQFPSGTPIPAGAPAERSYVLDSPRAAEARTKERYELLKGRFTALLCRKLGP